MVRRKADLWLFKKKKNFRKRSNGAHMALYMSQISKDRASTINVSLILCHILVLRFHIYSGVTIDAKEHPIQLFSNFSLLNATVQN